MTAGVETVATATKGFPFGSSRFEHQYRHQRLNLPKITSSLPYAHGTIGIALHSRDRQRCST
jgi:hypothetical protein